MGRSRRFKFFSSDLEANGFGILVAGNAELRLTDLKREVGQAIRHADLTAIDEDPVVGDV